jgi:hypothetical protein
MRIGLLNDLAGSKNWSLLLLLRRAHHLSHPRRLSHGFYSTRPPTEAALRGPTIDGHGFRTLGRRLRPYARKLDQGVFLCLGFGFGSPTHGLFGVLPELIGL